MTSVRIFRNARLIDPATERDQPGHVMVKGSEIAAIGPDLETPDGAEVTDCGGRILAPGFVDMRAHAVDLEAAVSGGFTTLALQPDQATCIDTDAVVERIRRRAEEDGRLRVYPMGAATKGFAGKEMAEIRQMTDAGAVAFTDCRSATSDARVMRRLLEYSGTADTLIVQFPEEPSLAAGGFAHEGEISTRLGLNGIPSAAEVIQIERDIRLAEMTGGRLHIALVTAKESVAVIAEAKARGVKVTAATAPHYLYLNHNALEGFRTFAKLSPPLRAEDDRLALIEAVNSGVIDTFVSDHDPKSEDVKRLPLAQAASGVAAFETVLPLVMAQVQSGSLSLMAALKALTYRPAQILGLKTGHLGVGAPADLVIIDPNQPWRLQRHALKSAAKNMIQDTILAQGKVWQTIVAGQTVYSEDVF